jgi:hypothetical protein
VARARSQGTLHGSRAASCGRIVATCCIRPGQVCMRGCELPCPAQSLSLLSVTATCAPPPPPPPSRELHSRLLAARGFLHMVTQELMHGGGAGGAGLDTSQPGPSQVRWLSRRRGGNETARACMFIFFPVFRAGCMPSKKHTSMTHEC